jgi:hypothetical protein
MTKVRILVNTIAIIAFIFCVSSILFFPYYTNISIAISSVSIIPMVVLSFLENKSNIISNILSAALGIVHIFTAILFSLLYFNSKNDLNPQFPEIINGIKIFISSNSILESLYSAKESLLIFIILVTILFTFFGKHSNKIDS